jgi:hypothetical protein
MGIILIVILILKKILAPIRGVDSLISCWSLPSSSW